MSPYIIGKLVEHNSRLRINDNSLIALVLYFIDDQHCGLDWTTQKRLYTLQVAPVEKARYFSAEMNQRLDFK